MILTAKIAYLVMKNDEAANGWICRRGRRSNTTFLTFCAVQAGKPSSNPSNTPARISPESSSVYTEMPHMSSRY